MAAEAATVWLDRAVDPATDHILGPPDAEITLVEYGSYDCRHCRAAHDRLAQLRDEFGDRLLYVFRHRPIPGNAIALEAARMVERAASPRQFWKAHVALMDRSADLTGGNLEAVAAESGLDTASPDVALAAKDRVQADIESAQASGVVFTPSFFINGRRYDGPWDDASFSEALMAPLGHRVRTAALDFVNWPASTGLLLLVATIAAVVLSNSALGPAFADFWTLRAGITWGEGGFTLPLLNWVNDGLLTIFFLVVGLEIKRELTIGHLSSRRLAAMPIAAAVGGMVVPALLYVLLVPSGPWTAGWGVPIATDTAFAVALIAVLGRRVPIELRIFLTAAAIVDDIAAIGVVALFYSSGLDFGFLLAALLIVGLLFGLNRIGVYKVAPYALLGIALWFCIHEGGVHATLAGVILALFIPTRPPPDYQALIVQPVGMLAASLLAVRLKLAQKPDEYDWLQVAGAGSLAGIGFTMSLFIAGQAFPVPADFDAAKIAVFAASLLAAMLGVGLLWWAGRRNQDTQEAQP